MDQGGDAGSGELGPAGVDRSRRAATELVEVVDADGGVERVVTRAEMRAHHLRHRCTYVVVVDRADRVIVHRRAGWKDLWPGRWDLAFGGVAGVGETWASAARRELVEEAGVDAGLQAVGGGRFDDHDVSVLGRVFLARHDGPFSFPDGEVVDSARIARSEVIGWIRGRSHCPDSVDLVAPVLAGDLPTGDLPTGRAAPS